MRRGRAVAALLGWSVLLAGALAALHAAGHGDLAGPDLRSLGSIRAWALGHDPVVDAMVMVRLAGIALCWYLIGTTCLGALARLLHAGRLVALLDRCTVAFARKTLTAVLGAGLTVGSLSAGAVAAAATNPPPGARVAVPTMHRLDAGEPQPPRMQLLPDAAAPKSGPPAEPAPTSTPLPADPPPSAATSGVGPPAEPAPLPMPPPPVAAASRSGLELLPDPEPAVTLQAGDHLWLVAERTLSNAWRRPVVAPEVAPYWRSLVEHNRERLVDPHNPDLVYPGQVILLPAVPTAAVGP